MKFPKLISTLSAGAISITAPIELAAERTFEVVGILRGARDNGNPVIEHEEIPGFMPAMTMAFNVKALDDIDFLNDGDHIRFTFHVGDSSSFADHFVVIGHEESERTEIKPSSPTKRLKAGDQLPNFTLVDESGAPLTANSFKGRTTLITFIFTRCPVPEFCPMLALKYGALQAEIQNNKTLGNSLRLLSITLDPAYDTPKVLKVYGNAVGANSEIWNFATGDEKQIESLVHAFGVKSERNGNSLDHTLTTALINKNGRIQKIWIGNRWKSKDVLNEL